METILDSNSYEDPNFTATGTCSGLKCLYTNANSLTNKMSELRYRAEGMDIIAVTETWTSPDIKDGEINIDGYTMFRKDRLHSKGGGVILYAVVGRASRQTCVFSSSNFSNLYSLYVLFALIFHIT